MSPHEHLDSAPLGPSGETRIEQGSGNTSPVAISAPARFLKSFYSGWTTTDLERERDRLAALVGQSLPYPDRCDIADFYRERVVHVPEFERAGSFRK